MKNAGQAALWSARKKLQQIIARSSFSRRRVQWAVWSVLVLTSALWLGLAAWQRAAAQQVSFNINTVVGSSGGTGLVADLKNPRGVAAASATIFYITDTDNHVVRRVDTAANSITIVAGKLGQAATDPTAVNGDGGLATNALLKQPYDVAIDVSGDLYISDTGNHKIRKVTFNGALTGNISTIAGNGSVGNVLGTVSDSIFSEPRGMAYSNLNNGTLYVADSGAHRVIAIPSLTGLTSNTQISVIAGNGNPGGDGDEGPPLQAQLNGPRGVALDGSRILIADTNNHKVREVTTVSGSLVIRTFAGTGTPGFNAESGIAATTLLNAPTDVVADAQSNVYVTDSGNHRIRKIDTSLTMTTMAGRTGNGFNGDGAPATAFTLNAPSGLIFINNSVVFMDTGNRRLRRVMGDTISSIVSDGSGGFAGDTGLATLAKLSGPSSIAVDSAGNWYIADTNNQVIRKVTASDSKISTIAGLPGMASVNPTDLNGDGGPATQATFKFPTGVAVDASGNIFVADTGNKRIRKIDHTTNVISTVMGLLGTTLNGVQALVEPVGVAVDTLNNLYVTDAGQHLVVVQRGDGATKLFIAGKANTPGFGGDGGTPENARLNRPTGITVAGSIVYFADTNNHRIRKIERINDNFQISSVVPQSVGVVQIIPRPGFEGDGLPVNNATRLNLPTGVAVDSLGNLFIVDRGNNRIRRVAPVTDLNTNITTNVINTVIGTGDIGFSGDGGPATAAALGLPLNITATATSILIADTGNNRIRQTTEPPNVAPVLVSPGDKTVNEGQALNFTVSASDGNAGQTLNYSMTSSPALPTTPAANAATLNPSTGAFSFTPAFDVVPNQANATKEFNVTFTVTDNGSPAKTDSKTIKITVSNVNGPPTISPGTVPATLEATAANGAQLQLSGSATDPDGDAPLTFIWTDTKPSQQPVTIATQATATVTLALGQHSLILTASDGKTGGTASSPAKPITVQDTTAPVFANLPSDISDSITSGNGKVETFTLPTATDTVSGVRPVTATPPSGTTFPVGVTTVTFSSSDTAGNTRTATIKVTITCVGTGCTGGGGGDPNATNYNINAFAGNGNFGTSGDSGAATTATLKEPRGVALDAAGNVYIADQEAHAIRRVNAQGNISLFAGAGVKGFAGDNGPAANARFNSPTGLAVDLTRNILFVADTGNHRIRRIDLATNTITTLAGNGAAGLGGDGPAANAQLNYPSAVAVDGAGVVYVADTGNNRVVKISNSKLAAVAGNGQVGNSGDGAAPLQAKLDHPTGLAVTSDGTTIFVADRGNNRVRKITSAAITNFAGNGNAATSGDGAQATAAGLNAPTDVAVDGAGNVFITETDGERIRRVNTSNVISTIAGNGAAGNTGDDGPAISATLNTPTGLVRNNSTGVIFFCDTGNLRVRRLLPAGSSNNPPVPAPLSNVLLSKSQSLQVALSATDADNDSVTFTLVPALSFVTIINVNAAARTATLLINPNNNNAGVYTVRVQAADSKGGTAQTPEFTITITDPNNNPPVAVMNTLAATLFAPSGAATATVNLNGTGSSDPDGDPITYAWFDGATQIAAGQMTTAQLAPGQHSIRLVVTDSKGATGSTTPQTVTVQAVTTGNRPPVAKIKNLPGEVFSANGTDAQVLLDGSDSSDPDGDPITYDWFDGNTKIATGVTAPVTLLLGQHSIKLVVTDDKTASNETTPQTVNVSATLPDIDITSVTPNSGRRGKTVIVTVNGHGFTQASYVTINKGGVTVTTTFISATQLSAKLVITDVAIVGARAVTVTNPSGGSATLGSAFSILQ